jgi:undecaprenyl-diphosphatase
MSAVVWIAEHAAASVGLCLAAAGLVVWPLTAPSGRDRTRAWLVAAVLAAWSLAALAWLMGSDVAVAQALRAADSALAVALRTGLSPDALQAWGGWTHAGDALLITALAAVVACALWRQGDRALMVVWLAGLAGNALTVRLLKVLVARARPLHDHGVWVIVSGSSFPSGHAAAAVMAWGGCAWLISRRGPALWHRRAWLLASALVVSIGGSRVLLQVHHASDVLAGWACGLAWLALAVVAGDLALQRWPQRLRQAASASAAGAHPLHQRGQVVDVERLG